MTVHLDTSVLIDALTGPRRALPVLIDLADRGHRLSVASLVLYEWLRGPRTGAELLVQEELFPREHVVPFGPVQADLSAKLYAVVKRPRGREIDLAIAACALSEGATLWTLNVADFRDVPNLKLHQ
jgi:predicted nucleic acid-binding protein